MSQQMKKRYLSLTQKMASVREIREFPINVSKIIPPSQRSDSKHTSRIDGILNASTLNQSLPLKEQLDKIQLLVKLQEKEILKLKELNKSLIISNQQKLELLHTERSLSHRPILQDQKQVQSPAFQRHGSQSSILSVSAFSPLIKKSIMRKLKLKFQDSNEDQPEKLNKLQKEKEKRIKQILSFLQAEEYFKINTILNMNQRDEEAISLYETDGTLILLDNLLQDEEIFMEILQTSSPQQSSFIYDKLKKNQQEHKQFFVMVLRLKKLLQVEFGYLNQGALQMSQKVLLDDAMQTIIDQIIECLECDRASCFIVDQTKNELWSQVAKGAKQVIRMPIGSGIAGISAQTKQIINVQNAYFDPRFNSDMDKASNYKTNTILACPIIHRDGCIGVLQCVNKQQGYFTKVDEALLLILADFSRIIMNNAINNDEQVFTRNRLRYSIKTGLMLHGKSQSRKDLLLLAQERLKSLMNVELARVAIFNTSSTLLYYGDDALPKEVDSSMGIMGQSIDRDKVINIFNCYQHPSFNPVVDLQTSLPVIVMPIHLNQNVIGAVQVANARGIGTVFQNMAPLISPIDQEVLEYFVLQLACILSYQGQHGQEEDHQSQKSSETPPG